MSKANVFDIYMDPNYGTIGADRHYCNQIKHYSRPIVASDGKNFIDESSQYPGVYSIPKDKTLFQLRDKMDIAVCVCLYNEDAKMVEATLNGIYKNLGPSLEIKRTINPKESTFDHPSMKAIQPSEETIQPTIA